MNYDNELNGSHLPDVPPAPAAPAVPAKKRMHPLEAAERQHIAEVRQQMDDFSGEVLKLKGAIFDKQQELSFMRRHLTLFLGQIATNAGLPMGSVLSPDGAALIAREE